MKLVSHERSLSLPSPSGGEGEVEVFSASPPGEGQGLKAAFLPKLPDPRALPYLLQADQVWAEARLIPSLELMGLPPGRILPAGGLDQVEPYLDRFNPGPYDLVFRGRFGRNSSLEWVNSMLLSELETGGRRVLLASPGDPPASLEVPGLSQSWPPDFLPASRGPLVLYAPWEYYYAPREWVERGPEAVNRWFTPSLYAKQGMVESGLSDQWIEVIPNGVDLEAFSPDGPKIQIDNPDGRTVFLFVGGTIFRKGVDLLQEAWQQAFSPDDPVMLLIKDFGSDSHYRGQNALSGLSRWAEREDLAPVKIISDNLLPDSMPELYRAADVGVFPYRGEGFCMPALEAMASGLPIIYPDQGPTTEYCKTGGISVKTSPRRLKPPSDIELILDPLVHEADIDSLTRALRRLSDPGERADAARRARREAELMGWDKPAEKADLVLREVAQEKPVYSFPPLRPQGEKIIIAARPDWQVPSFAAPVCELLLGADPALPVSLCLLSDGNPGRAELLLSALQSEGFDTQADFIDVSVVEDTDWLSLALGSDLILLLGAPEPYLGRSQLSASSILSLLEAKSGW